MPFDYLKTKGYTVASRTAKSSKVLYVLLVTQLCLTLCNPIDCSLPDFSVHGILQARILEWVAMSSFTTYSN